MAIAVSCCYPCANHQEISSAREKIFNTRDCGVLFASDVAAWNIAIQESSATQASLLTNLSPLCGIISCF
jgi:hypothetical protein